MVLGESETDQDPFLWDRTLPVGFLGGEVPPLGAPQTLKVCIQAQTGACENGQGHSDTCWGF